MNALGPNLFASTCRRLPTRPDENALHVSLIEFHSGSHTIHRYDLAMESAKARNLANFHVHMLVETAKSRARLESWECFTHNQVIAFRGLVVGIGFSDLRCALGESVEGLFLQDAFDDEHPGVLFESGAGPLHHLKTSKGVSDAQ